ncbi:unnamed protein product [Chrysodeixis includens]|uniref:Alpha-1,6-mannosyl-glycoprotein 2-beta-N-acetylglucosaminyltransferase n=1 Tax=Chrysodeixis includens TaxID=689277 RepID=A0A9P0BMS7_CHRIL|nr:unnamed protein product [Chrysodeixis includens]
MIIHLHNLIFLYRLISILIVLTIMYEIYQQMKLDKQKKIINQYNIYYVNLRSYVNNKNVTERPFSMTEEIHTIKEMKTQIKRINLGQKIYNMFLGPIDHKTQIIVIQVRSNLFYFQKLLASLKKARGISKSLLVFSHDYYDSDINNAVKSVNFAKYMQIFYPYSIQLYPNVYPGYDSKLCTEGYVCTSSEARDAALAQEKHHWWWQANQIFDNMPVTNNYYFDVLFLEESNYVTEDFLYAYKLLQGVRPKLCSYCELLSLGAHKPQLIEYQKSRARLIVEIWTDNMLRIGIAFNRDIWNAVKSWRRDFCYYNDYNWDVSLRSLGSRKWNRNIFVLGILGSRVLEIEKCDSRNASCTADNFVDTCLLNRYQRTYFQKK